MTTSPTATRLFVIPLLALLAAPVAAFAAPPSRSTSAGRTTMSTGSSDPSMGARVGAIDYSVLLSLEFPPSGFNAGPRLTGEVMYGFIDLSPQARLSLGGRGAFSYHGSDFIDTSLWILEAVPDAKLTFAVMPNLSLYGDVGLGLALLRINFPTVAAIPPFFAGSGSDTSLQVTFQFGGGVSYAVSPNMNLLGEVRFDIYTRSGSSTFISIPTVGLQFH